MAEAQPAISEPSTPDAHDGEHEEDARVDDLADRALARADRDGDEDEEVREEGDGGGELEDTAVGAGRDDVFLLRELHAVGDELGPAVEAARVHGAEAALHMGHHLVLGLPDDQGEDEEHDEDDEESQGDVESVVHACLRRAPRGLRWRRAGVCRGLFRPGVSGSPRVVVGPRVSGLRRVSG